MTVLHRWPTFAAIALATLTGLGLTSGAEVAPIVTASGFVYLGAAALENRAAAWPLFLVGFVLVSFGFVWTNFNPSWWMLGAVAAMVAYSIRRGAVGPLWGIPLQTLAMIGLTAVALVAGIASTTWAGVLVACGLFAHALWDVWHHWRDRVVTRSLAEFCGVLDTALAIAVLSVTFA